MSIEIQYIKHTCPSCGREWEAGMYRDESDGVWMYEMSGEGECPNGCKEEPLIDFD
jgi:hypothetical protein